MSEAILKKRHGWSKTWKIAANYEHIIHDVDNAVFERYGLKDSTDKETEWLPRKCNICKRVNPYDATLCLKCGKYLNLKTVIT